MFSKYPTSHFLSLTYDEISSLGNQNVPKYLYLEKEELIRFWVSEISIQNVENFHAIHDKSIHIQTCILQIRFCFLNLFIYLF